MSTYCPQCAGDPRRKANIEPHKQHAPASDPYLEGIMRKLEPQPAPDDWLDA